ncbi:TatD family hydrolase [Thioflexithrix psekupsensis]|uniref:TatD family deoxyribonuclease n=1 Tax=Thioflexithrix psekupsensis TaxID=1570016 RepID=A0A251XB19_9GAMM|nr:TatD family hydrolase [Thioflexithrix psekupsensis]OUD15559.1 TatD family deoxyribonuclease [Thioflexithrix psekupsensis]
MLVDSHCHLDQITVDTPENLIETAHLKGVSHFLCVAIDESNISTVLALATQFDSVFASVGVHPAHLTESTPEMTVDELLQLADNDRVIAIGETGLDYYHHKGDLAWQKQRFRNHIAAAKEIGKPLIIHTRESHEDTLAILKQEKADHIGGVMHCFVEDWETAQKAMDLGFYISLSGIVTFKTAKVLHDVAKKMPLSHLLVETDAPYLAPVPHRGKVNQPAYVCYVADYIAELRNESVEDIASATTDNFFRLFSTASHPY